VALLTTVDQVLSSASNALMVVALAQVSSAPQFGIIALLITVLAVWTGFNRGALGTPLLLTSNLSARQITVESGYAVSWSLWTAVLGGVVFIAGGAAFHQPTVGLAFALTLPAVLAQDVLRHTAIGLGRPGLAVVADGLWTASLLILFVANLCGVHESAESAIYLWGLGGLVSAVLLGARCAVALRHRRILQWWKTYWRARARFGSVYSVSQIGLVLVTLAALITAGSVAAAGIRGAWTLFGPIGTLVGAMPAVFVPHAARNRDGGLGNQWRLVRTTSLVTSVLTIVATACLMNVPTTLGAAVLGATWTEASSLIPYLGVTTAAMCWLIGAFTYFSAHGASKTVFRLNLLHIGLQVTTSFAAGVLFDSAAAIAMAIAASSCVMAGAGGACVHLHIRAATRPASLPLSSTVNSFGRVPVQ
jgi:hypothetical protein